MKILLVEDHPTLAKISCLLLREEHKHEVAWADSGERALELAASFLPEMILIDINLPEMNGYQLAEKLRENPHYHATILVGLTGFGNFINDSRARTAGLDAYFKKPMDFSLLPQLKRLPPETDGVTE